MDAFIALAQAWIDALRNRDVRALFPVPFALCLYVGFHYFPSRYSLIAFLAGIIYVVLLLKFESHPGQPAKMHLLKGAAPFFPGEEERYEGLERDDDVERLAGWFSGYQVGVVQVYGPSVVGKTSLVNVGFRGKFKQSEDTDFIYVDLNKADPEAAIIRKLVEYSSLEFDANDLPIPEKLSRLLAEEPSRRQILVLDHFEYLPPSEWNRLIGHLRATLQKNQDFQRMIVVVVDEELSQSFEELLKAEGLWLPSGPNVFKKHQVKMFTMDNALNVSRALRNRADIGISDDVLERIVYDLSFAQESGSREISPLALSVAVRLVAAAAGSRIRLDLEDYLAANGYVGLMSAHLKSLVDKESVRPRGEVLQILAAGVGQLGRRMSLDDFPKAILDDLSSQEVRILRPENAMRSKLEFRVLESWWPALKIFSKDSNFRIPAAIETFRARFAAQFASWGLEYSAGDGKRPYWRSASNLLTLRQLRYLKNTPGVLDIASASRAREFIRASQVYRGIILALSLFIGLSILASAVPAVHEFNYWVTLRSLHDWGLTRDIPSYKGKLTKLSLVGQVDRLDWVPSSITVLETRCHSIASLAGLPPGLIHLSVRTSVLKSWRRLPPNIGYLDLSFTGVKDLLDLKGLKKLTTLRIEGLPVTDFWKIPRTVTSLSLRSVYVQSLRGLPERLTHLELKGTSVTSLKDLPSEIKELVLADNANLKVDYLPPLLASLSTDRMPEDGVIFPQSFRRLAVSNLGTLSSVPDQLTGLELSKTTLAGNLILPGGLKMFVAEDEISAVSPERLPAGVTQLKLPWKLIANLNRPSINFSISGKDHPRSAADFSHLPLKVTNLDLSFSAGLEDVDGLSGRPIKDLNLSGTYVRGLGALPVKLESLKFNYYKFSEIDEFPDSLAVLDLSGSPDLKQVSNLPLTLVELNLGDTGIEVVPKLQELKFLKKLDISNTQIKKLPSLPDIEELTLHVGQLDSLQGLPLTVNSITFVPDKAREGRLSE